LDSIGFMPVNVVNHYKATSSIFDGLVKSMIDIDVDTTALEAAIAEFSKVGKKELSEAMRQAGGTMVGQLIGVTPPSHQKTLTANGGAANSAKIAGEKRLAGDILKLFPVTKKKAAEVLGMVESKFKWTGENGRKQPVSEAAFSEGELARIHQKARSRKTGRTNAGYGANMAITRAALRKEYIKRETRKVGKLSAGWLKAAQELKTPPRYLPAWIKRHGAGPGGATVRDSGGIVSIRIFNSNSWFGPGWERRMSYVVSRTEKALTKAATAILERRAKAANARMNR